MPIGDDNLSAIITRSRPLHSTMSLFQKTLTRASGLASRQLTTPVLARSYAAYPFTFPNDSTVTPQASDAADKAPKSPYPFTHSGASAEGSSPAAPQTNRGRAGDETPDYMQESELMKNQEGEYTHMEMSSRQPDYSVTSDYRTSYGLALDRC